MFIHLFIYRTKVFLRSKDFLLWLLLFPIALGSMFHFAFGNLMTEDGADFDPVPIAIVSVGAGNQELQKVVKELSNSGKDRLFSPKYTTQKKATKLLHDEKVDGILFLKQTPTITVSQKGINQSILESFLSQYLQHLDVIKHIIKDKPSQLNVALAQLQKDISYNKQLSLTRTKQNNLIQYFYALIAMVCLYGSFLGRETACNLQPHLSEIGARKCSAPVHKMKMILAEFSASVVLNYLSVLLLIAYLILILGIDFGEKLPLVLLSSFFGSIIGIALGIVIGAIGKWSDKTKEGLTVGISMLLCFLGGLMFNQMPNIIEQHAPIINRINPAALLTDSFHCLSIYDTYDRFIRDLSSMGIIAAVLCFLSYLLLRKKAY